MKDTSSLDELARFSPASPLASAEAGPHRAALHALRKSFEPGRPVHRRVSDLLGAVLVLSARTRRVVLPRVEIDIDVFAPGGARALRLFLPRRNA